MNLYEFTKSNDNLKNYGKEHTKPRGPTLGASDETAPASPPIHLTLTKILVRF